jgi:uncharacterized protein (UPF0548 family)
MFIFKRPSVQTIDAFLARASITDFTYRYIGRTRNGFRKSRKNGDSRKFNVDHNQIVIGNGEEQFERAKQAIRDWKMFDMSWVELYSPRTPIEEGQTVAILIQHFGFYSLNSARIVYTIDKWDWFGFAYGTLQDHGEAGEERFSVRLDRESGDVIYDLYAFSRPKHILARLGYPLTRMLQRSFAADSMAAMARSIVKEHPK